MVMVVPKAAGNSKVSLPTTLMDHFSSPSPDLGLVSSFGPMSRGPMSRGTYMPTSMVLVPSEPPLESYNYSKTPTIDRLRNDPSFVPAPTPAPTPAPAPSNSQWEAIFDDSFSGRNTESIDAGVDADMPPSAELPFGVHTIKYLDVPKQMSNDVDNFLQNNVIKYANNLLASPEDVAQRAMLGYMRGMPLGNYDPGPDIPEYWSRLRNGDYEGLRRVFNQRFMDANTENFAKVAKAGDYYRGVNARSSAPIGVNIDYEQGRNLLAQQREIEFQKEMTNRLVLAADDILSSSDDIDIDGIKIKGMNYGLFFNDNEAKALFDYRRNRGPLAPKLDARSVIKDLPIFNVQWPTPAPAPGPISNVPWSSPVSEPMLRSPLQLQGNLIPQEIYQRR